MSVHLEITGVRHRYRSAPEVLCGLDLDVPAGTTTTLLGPSGSGKSTLLAVVAGVETPAEGDVRFDGRSVADVPAAKRGVAMVLQQPHLFPHLSVAENAAFGLAARGVPRRTRLAEARRLLDGVGLADMAARRPRELSGGEQQRVALVRALAIQPRLLLLDEPLASLDPGVRETMQVLLRRLLADSGTTALLVTHDRAEAMALGHRTALLIDGRIAAHLPPDELFAHPPTAAAAAFMGVTLFIRGTVGRGVLHTSDGPIRVSGLGGAAGRVTVIAIRPEHVTVEDRVSVDGVPGQVVGCTYRGEHWDVEVHTALGRLRARNARSLAPGSAVRVALPPERLFEVHSDGSPDEVGS
ncbi:MAG: ABC transporter ATP-binding protein [Thermoleophilia bacterium]